MYIYSLRPFLTTKGALINGKQGGQKTTPKSEKVVKISQKKIKMIKNRSKINIKNRSKKVIS